MDKTINQTGVLLVVILLILFFGFAYLKANDQLQFIPGTGENFLQNSSWKLIELQSNGVKIQLPPASFTAAFSENELTGTTPCNTYRSPYTIKGMAVSFSAITLSTTECDPENTPSVNAYLEALSSIRSFKVVQNVLTLFPGVGGRSLLVYERM